LENQKHRRPADIMFFAKNKYEAFIHYAKN
jgi:hypothetical protein